MSGKNQLPDLEKIFQEDDDGFLPSGGSRLASIFGLSTNKVPNNIFLPVKQSGPNNVVSAQETKTEVIIAKAVHAFKLQNGQYTSMGKLGIALAGNASTRSYQLILYRSKQEHVSVVSITPDFLYTVQANNYSTYYDTRKENWSILFENTIECMEFAREVGLSRYLSRREKSDNSIIYQNLNDPEKSITAKEGDELTVKYNISTEIVQPLKSYSTAELTMSIEISTDDNWERILLGSNQNLRRLLILPPSKQISLGPGFPKDRDIALEIEILDIQSKEEVKVPEVKLPGVSSKAAILSRMAKMGQSILPKTSVSTTTDSEDTEDEVKKDRMVRHRKAESSENLSKKHLQSTQATAESVNNLHKVARSKHISPSPVTNTQGSLIPVVYAPQWSPTQIQPQYVTMDGQTFSVAQQTVAQPMSATLDPSLNVFLAETRTQNTEIRMGMSKIADNVQKLLDKFHILELQNAASPNNDRTLENTLKMFLTLNASQTEMKNVSSSSDTHVKPNLAEERSENLLQEQLEKTISAQEEDLKILRELINSTELQLLNVQEGKRDLEKVNFELKERIKNFEVSLKVKNEELDNRNSNLEKTKESLNDYERKHYLLEKEISQLRADCKTLEQAANTKPKNMNSKKEKTKEIKLIMNKTYYSLMEQFTEESYPTSFIKETIAATLRHITLQVLKDNKTEEELSETSSSEMDKNDHCENSERLSVSRSDIERVKVENQSRVESEIASSNSETNVNKFVQIAPAFENEPPPIPPMDLSNENEWSDN